MSLHQQSQKHSSLQYGQAIVNPVHSVQFFKLETCLYEVISAIVLLSQYRIQQDKG